jgi:hypothetical protein
MQGKRETGCIICSRSFIAHPKVGARQKTCGRAACRKIHKKNNNAKWRQNNPDYSKNDYARLKAWLEENSGYLKRYRQTHPEYVQKNRDAQRRRDRTRKLNLDIQAKLKRQQAEITKQLEIAPAFSDLDIQAEFTLEQSEITYLLSQFVHLPCLDIQTKFYFSSPLLDNGAIKQGGGAYGCQMDHRS